LAQRTYLHDIYYTTWMAIYGFDTLDMTTKDDNALRLLRSEPTPSFAMSRSSYVEHEVRIGRYWRITSLRYHNQNN
jgi:hypothetical protein